MNEKEREDREAKREAAHRQITVVPDDFQMYSWLAGLFQLSPKPEGPGNQPIDPKTKKAKPNPQPDQFPERVVLRQLKPGLLDDMGPQLKHEDWKPTLSRRPLPEDLVTIGNNFRAVAQHDCNVIKKPQTYGLFAYSSLKGAAMKDPKGAVGIYYSRYLFDLQPTAREYGDRTRASDDDDTHRDRLMAQSLEHNRWTIETFMTAQGSLMRLQHDIIGENRAMIAQMEADRRASALLIEELQSKKLDRQIAYEMSQMKIQAMQEGLRLLSGFVPVLTTYLTKGKHGFIEGVKQFGGSLSPEQREQLFGKWENNEQLTPGVLDKDQCQMFDRLIVEADPQRVLEFAATMRPEQLAAAQSILSPAQLLSLQGLIKAASDIIAKQQSQPS